MTLSVFGSTRQRQKCQTARVWLNGRDVTADCQKADARLGRVLLLKRNEKGHPYFDPRLREVAREWRYGRVRIQRGGWRP